MSSTFGVFESAKSGLSVAMQQLNVTEQNIANVNTEGYTRQRILTSAKEPPSSEYLIAPLNKVAIGQGVEATGIQQIRSSYLDQQFRGLNSSYSYSSSRSEALEYMTGIYNELNEDGSLTTSIGKFFSALNTFTTDTSSQEFRTNVQQQAISMTQTFNNVYEEMVSLWNDQNASIATAADKINSIGQKMAELNLAIAKAEQTGGTANDLRDERNLLLDELSGYVNMTYAVNQKNPSMVDVNIGGLSFVNGVTANMINTDGMANHQTDINTCLDTIAGNNSSAPFDAALLGAIEELSNYGDFSFEHSNPSDPNSDWIVKLGGQTLVAGSSVAMYVQEAAAIDTAAWAEFNRNWLTLDDPSTTTVVESLSITSGTVTNGKLYSYMEMITNQSAVNPGIPYYMDQVNGLVRDIAKSINNIHLQGYTYPDGVTVDVNGTPTDSVRGVMFFAANPVPVDANTDGNQDLDVDGYPIYDYTHAYDNLTAGNFSLSDEVLASIYNIAGSSSQVVLGNDSTQSGNNEIALQMFNDLANSRYYDKLNSIVGNLAIAANTSDSILSTRTSLLGSVDTQRLSISAVSLDEETTNLIVFQQSYNACARIIQTLDEMLGTLINMAGN